LRRDAPLSRPGAAVTPAQLKDLYARKASAMSRRPAFARGSGQARVRLGPDLLCDVEHPTHSLVADAPPGDGGQGLGPDPGELMAASLGASLAMGYRLWSARLDVPIEGAEVDVMCEYDLRGQLGTGDAPVGWQRLVVTATVRSQAPEAAVRHMVDLADRHCPMLANLSPRIELIHRLTIARR
jgi:uncharacterized OsmC-like protein